MDHRSEIPPRRSIVKPHFEQMRPHTSGDRYAAYESAKAVWDADNPAVDYRTRDAAMQRLARSMGV